MPSFHNIKFEIENGLTLSIAQFEGGAGPINEGPEIALIDKNGEFVTDNYNNGQNDLTGGGETIRNATFEQLANLISRLKFSGPPRKAYYDEKQFQTIEEIRSNAIKVLDAIEPIAANAAQLEEATRPRVNKNGRPVYTQSRRKPKIDAASQLLASNVRLLDIQEKQK